MTTAFRKFLTSSCEVRSGSITLASFQLREHLQLQEPECLQLREPECLQLQEPEYLQLQEQLRRWRLRPSRPSSRQPDQAMPTGELPEESLQLARSRPSVPLPVPVQRCASCVFPCVCYTLRLCVARTNRGTNNQTPEYDENSRRKGTFSNFPRVRSPAPPEIASPLPIRPKS